MALAAAVNFKVAGQQVTHAARRALRELHAAQGRPVRRQGAGGAEAPQRVPEGPACASSPWRGWWRRTSPDGLDLATGRMGSFLGAQAERPVHRRRRPRSSRPCPWNDTQLATEAGLRAAALERAFHRLPRGGSLRHDHGGDARARQDARARRLRSTPTGRQPRASPAPSLRCGTCASAPRPSGTTRQLPLCEILGASQEFIYQTASVDDLSPRRRAHLVLPVEFALRRAPCTGESPVP